MPFKGDQAAGSYRNLNAGWDDTTRQAWHQIHPPQKVVVAAVWRQKSRGHFVSTYTAAEIYPLQAPETQPTRK